VRSIEAIPPESTMRQPNLDPALFPTGLPGSGWGPWSHESPEPAPDGPGLLVSRAFWAGGAVSVALWGCATWLVIAFL
jgi:hypothetical protein